MYFFYSSTKNIVSTPLDKFIPYFGCVKKNIMLFCKMDKINIINYYSDIDESIRFEIQ